jgi:hypothetical protein
VGLDNARDLERVARYLERDAIVAAEAPGEELERRRRRLDPTRRYDLAVLRERDLAEVAVDVQTDCSHLNSLLAIDERRSGGQTTQTDSCSQHNQASRRGGHRNGGLEAHRAINGLPSLRSPRRPLSR